MADLEPQCPILQCANFVTGHTNRFLCGWSRALFCYRTVWCINVEKEQLRVIWYGPPGSGRSLPMEIISIAHGKRGMNRDKEEDTWWGWEQGAITRSTRKFWMLILEVSCCTEYSVPNLKVLSACTSWNWLRLGGKWGRSMIQWYFFFFFPFPFFLFQGQNSGAIYQMEIWISPRQSAKDALCQPQMTVAYVDRSFIRSPQQIKWRQILRWNKALAEG